MIKPSPTVKNEQKQANVNFYEFPVTLSTVISSIVELNFQLGRGEPVIQTGITITELNKVKNTKKTDKYLKNTRYKVQSMPLISTSFSSERFHRIQNQLFIPSTALILQQHPQHRFFYYYAKVFLTTCFSTKTFQEVAKLTFISLVGFLKCIPEVWVSKTIQLSHSFQLRLFEDHVVILILYFEIFDLAHVIALCDTMPLGFLFQLTEQLLIWFQKSKVSELRIIFVFILIIIEQVDLLGV